MLTPAEELGLSGLNLDSRVRRVFYGIPQNVVAEMIGRMTRRATEHQLIYMRAGETETIRVLLRPIGVMPDQLAYLHYVSLTLLNALKRLPDLYIQDFDVRAAVPLMESEEKWLWDTWGPSHRENNPVFGRLDAVIEFTSPMWKDSLRFVEPNLSCIGGIHLGPTCEQLLAELVLPVLQEFEPSLRMELGQDLRELFIQDGVEHLEAVGRKGQTLCFVEPKYADEGPCEQSPLADYYHARHGMKVLHADPSELTHRNGEVYFGDEVVDVAYRDYEVRDIVGLEAKGIDIRPLRMLFKQNRMISSICGDFDHKSCWEILTDPKYTQKYFNAEERQVFRRHVLWTRVLRDRRTTLPDGDSGSLLDFARRDHEMLVLKPNRSYGGDRVLIGPLVGQAEWDSALDAALASGGDWVVQQLASIPVNEFPVLAPDGSVHVEPFYTVMGFAPTKYGVSILGRASQKQVVNVAQRGGMCGILIGRPPGKLIGPGEEHKLESNRVTMRR